MMMMCDEFEVGRGERPSSSSGGTQKVAALSLSFSVFFFSVKSKGVLCVSSSFAEKKATQSAAARDKALRDESRVSLLSRVFF